MVQWEKSLLPFIEKGHHVEEKYTYGLWGAAAGAALLAIVGFTWGNWHTHKGAKLLAEAEVQAVLMPYCAKEVMADPTAAEELKVKRTSDYDDVVRDFRKRANLTDKCYQYNRTCGKVIEGLMPKTTATKS